MIQRMLAIWSLVPLPFLNPAWASVSSRLLLKPGLGNFEHYFASVCCCCCWVASVVSDSVRPHRRQPTRLPFPGILQARTLEWVAISFSNTSIWDECNCVVVWSFFGIAFLWVWNENYLFLYYGHCWVFQICWCIECSTFTASYFRIWNSSIGIPSPPLALFVWCFLRPTWLHIPGCLAFGEWSHHHDYLGCEDLFCIVLLCILATCSSASVRFIPFLPSIVPIFVWNVPLVSLIFLKRFPNLFCKLRSWAPYWKIQTHRRK